MATYGPTTVSAPAGAIIIHPGDNVSAIVSAAPAGATFYFQAGEYRGVSISPKDNQTFIGEKGAVLNGSAVLTGFAQQGNAWVVGGQTQEGLRNMTDHASAMRGGYPETVFLDDKPLTPVDSLSKLGTGKFYFDYAADKIYIGDNPAGHTVEAGKLAYAFMGTGKNVTVQNFVVEKYDSPAQHGAIGGGYTANFGGPQGWTVDHNEVALNYGTGIRVGSNSEVTNNYVHDNGQMGLGGSGNNVLVQGNEVASNGWWAGVDMGWEGGGGKFSKTDGLMVKDNYAHDNNGFGFWTDIDNIHTTYDNNLFVHNAGGGISHEISYDATIKNNTFIGNDFTTAGNWLWGSAIQLQNSKNVEVYNNRIDATSGGDAIGLIQQNRGSGTYGTYTTTGNHIHDNIIVGNSATKTGGVADYNQSGLTNGGNVWSNNHYYLPANDSDAFSWGNTVSFDQFRAATGENGTVSQAYPNTSSWASNTGTSSTTTGNGAGSGTSGSGTGTGTGSGTSGTTGSGTSSGGNTQTGGSSTGGTTSGGSSSGSTDSHTGSGTGSGTASGGNSSGGATPGGGTSAGSGSTGGSTTGGTNTGTSGTDSGGGSGTQVPTSTTQNLVGDKHANIFHAGTVGDVAKGLGGGDQLYGGTGNDRLYGGPGHDLLSGGGGHDSIFGGRGRDIIVDAGGAAVNGGLGKDVLILDGTLDDYTVESSKGAVKFTDAGDVTTVVRNVEQFAFAGDDSTYALKHHKLVAADLADSIRQLMNGIVSQGSSSTTATSTNDTQLTELQELDLSSATAARSDVSAHDLAALHDIAGQMAADADLAHQHLSLRVIDHHHDSVFG